MRSLFLSLGMAGFRRPEPGLGLENVPLHFLQLQAPGLGVEGQVDGLSKAGAIGHGVEESR